MSHGLLIATLGILVTFTGLAVLALLVWTIGQFDVWRRRLFALRSRAAAEGRFEKQEPEENGRPSLELVAVITAALEAAMGRPVQVRHVRYLRSVTEDEGAWTRIGRLQVMASHAVVRRDT